MLQYTGKFVALDLETTGLDPEKSEIIEVAAVKYNNGKKEGEFQSFVKPHQEISFLVQALTSITDKDVEKAPFFHDIKNELCDFISDYPLLGQNIAFDISFLKKNGISIAGGSFDTRVLASILLHDAPALNLEVLALHLGLPFKHAHRALADVNMTIKVFNALFKKLVHMLSLHAEIREKIMEFIHQHAWNHESVFERAIEIINKNPKRFSRTGKQVSPRIQDTVPSIPSLPTLGSLDHILTQTKTIKQRYPEYEFRSSQTELVKTMHASLTQDSCSIIESEKRTGRGLALCLAAIQAAKETGEQIAISTSYTHAHKMMEKDLPIAQKILNLSLPLRPIHIIASPDRYVCSARLERFAKRNTLNPSQVISVVKMMLWLQPGIVDTGRIDEINLAQEDYSIFNFITGTSQCQKGTCLSGEGCYVQQALRRAKKSPVVVFDHRFMLLNALTYKELKINRMIIDEAHDLELFATQALSTSVGIKDLLTVIDPLFVIDDIPELLLADLKHMQDKITLSFGVLGMFAQKRGELRSPYVQRFVIDKNMREDHEWQRVMGSFVRMEHDLGMLEVRLRKLVEDLEKENDHDTTPELKNAIQKIEEKRKLLFYIFEKYDSAFVYIISLIQNGEVFINMSPLRVSHYMKKYIYKKQKSTVLLSSVRSGDPAQAFLRDRLGMDKTFSSHSVPTPDTGDETLVAIVKDMDDPNSQAFRKHISQTIVEVSTILQGKTLVLFPSLSIARTLFEDVYCRVHDIGIDVYADGVLGSSAKMAEKYRANEKSIILGGPYFWERIDFKLTNLACVMVVKLPFPLPFDPLFKAQSEEYQNSFIELAVPKTAMKFRQGYDRLIQSHAKKGLFLVFDTRVLKSYGDPFLKSLPSDSLEYWERAQITTKTTSWFHKSDEK